MIVKVVRDGPSGPRVVRFSSRRRSGRWVRAQVGVEFKPQDMWVGVYWDGPHQTVFEQMRLDVWVCLIPMVPIHIRIAER